MKLRIRRRSRTAIRICLALVIATTALFPEGANAQIPPAQATARPRVIATTDGEIDDRCSMVRFLMYANEWEVEDLIYSSSRFHWLGQTWSGIEWINSQIDQYARVYDHLKQHANGYPTPEELKRVVYVGNISNVGEMEQESPGADRIVRVVSARIRRAHGLDDRALRASQP
jgi:hypothetical protein